MRSKFAEGSSCSKKTRLTDHLEVLINVCFNEQFANES